MNKDIMEKKIKNNIIIDNKSKCWNWIGSIAEGKYPRIHHNGRILQARRVSFEVYYGEIHEAKIVVDTTCKNIKCVNPEHLTLDMSSNRFIGGHEERRNKTHCKYGHTLSDAIIDNRGQRKCRHCDHQRKVENKKVYVSKSKKLWTHCKHGHSLEDAYIKKNGSRNCKTCVKLNSKRQNVKK